MIDCVNAEVRDLLPDLLHGKLAGEVEAMVRTHLGACPDCRAELELLSQARAAMAPVRSVDTAAISTSIPAYRRRQWLVRASVLRIAAGIVLVALGGASYSIVSKTWHEAGRIPAESAIAVAPDSAWALTQPSADPMALEYRLDLMSDDELREFLAEIRNMDAILPEEPRSLMPALGEPGAN